jgi:hypothetical protein
MQRPNSPYHKDPTLLIRNILLIITPLIAGGGAIVLGRDINWDLKNYHYYNAYAFVTQRLEFDIAPAQLQTFINPLGHLLFYWLTEHYPSWVTGFVLGTLHGINLSLLFLIFWKTSTNTNSKFKLHIGILLTLISGVAPGFLSELGNTMNDNLVSLFIISALLLLLSALKNKTLRQFFMIGAAGLSMGFGVGIKQTIGIFALASAFALFVQPGPWPERIKRLMIYGLTGLVGGLLSGGYWAWEMWLKFKNPFFPFYNDIFKSPYFSSMPFNWDLFLPNQPWQYFLWPLLFSQNGSLVNPLHFSDIRFGLLYLLCLAWLLTKIKKTIASQKDTSATRSQYNFDQDSGNYLLTFFGVAFLLWMLQFSNYRYMISLELLVPLCFLIIQERVISSHKIQMHLALGALILTLACFRPFDWGRMSWDDKYFEVEASVFNTADNAIVILLGRAPISYVIPQFPENYRFIRPEGNIQTYVAENGLIQPRPDERQLFVAAAKDVLRSTTGPIYILYDKNETGIQPKISLQNLGIASTLDDCFILRINTPDKLEICRVIKK